MGFDHPLWTGQVFKGRINCDKWNREGWGPVELIIEVTGIRSKTEFVALTKVKDPDDNVRASDIWMQADGVFDPRLGELTLMETSVHAKSGDNTIVTPFVWHGFLDGVRLKGNFKAAGVQDIEYGDTALNMMCISGGAKTHILAGSAAMDEVKSRIGGLANALEAEAWERRKMTRSGMRRVELGLGARLAEQSARMNGTNPQIQGQALANKVTSESAAAANLRASRQSFVRQSMDAAANRSSW